MLPLWNLYLQAVNSSIFRANPISSQTSSYSTWSTIHWFLGLIDLDIPALSHFSPVWLFRTLWTVAHQVTLSVGFSRQEYWNRLPCPLPGYLPHPGIQQVYCLSCNGRLFLYHSHHLSQSVQSLSRVRLFVTPWTHSTPGLPVHRQLPEFTQTHVYRVSDAIQPSHPPSFFSPPAPNPSQHQSLFQWVNSSHEVAKVPQFQL